MGSGSTGLARAALVALLMSAAFLGLGPASATASGLPIPGPVTEPPPGYAGSIESVIAMARSYLGYPYRLGAEGPLAFDCSGLVYRAFAAGGQLGSIGGARSRAAGYLRWFAARGQLTTDVEMAERGDLVIYGNGEHIGIYLGDGRVISALTNGVSVHSLYGITLSPTAFLLVDWAGTATFAGPPLAPVIDAETPAQLITPSPWVPSLLVDSGQPIGEPGVTPVERVDMRRANSRTFEATDGAFTTEVFTQPIFYQAEGADHWLPIDLRFQAEDTVDDVAIAANAPTTVTLNDTAGDFITVTSGQHSLAIGSAGDVHSPASVPQIAEDGRFADYRDFPLGASGLRVFPRSDGFKAFIVLAAEPQDAQFTFTIDAPGTTLVTETDGSVTLRDDGGGMVGRLVRPLMLDSSDIAGDGGGVYSAAVSMTATAVDSPPTVRLAVARAYLEEAVYPVYIDLTLAGFPSGVAASTSAFASSAHPNGTFSAFQRPEPPAYPELWLGHQPGSRNDNEVYLRFAGIADLLLGVDVHSASMQTFPYWQYDHEVTAPSWLTAIAADWAADTISWNSRPAVGSELGEYGSMQGAWSDIDVTTYVDDVVGGVPDYGLMLNASGTGRANWKRLLAENQVGATPSGPRLVVHWSGLRPIARLPASDPTLQPTLNWSHPGVAPEPSSYQVQVSSDGFLSIAVDHRSRRAAFETQWTVPPEELRGGVTYLWRVRARYGAARSWSDWSAAMSFTYIPAGIDQPAPVL